MATQASVVSRRQFLRVGAAGAALFHVVPRHVLGGQRQRPPSGTIDIAAIGVGGQGGRDLRNFEKENIVALCDVDDRSMAGAAKRYPKAKRFRDFRTMLDAVEKEIDAVLVGTPDHTHAVASMDALRRGKHLYCEKPLAHSIGEVRQLMAAARKHKAITQLGNQGHSSEHIRLLCEWVWDGAIGDVALVLAACSRPESDNRYFARSKLPLLEERPEVPKELDWDLWLGPAQQRPYQSFYLPRLWRGWMPFGSGIIGDWICHVVDPAFWALGLGAPTTVQAEVDGYDPERHADVYPMGARITFGFPRKGKRGPVTLVWYDGARKLPRPKDLEKGRSVPGTGAILAGSKGKIMHGSHGAGGCRIIPEAKMKAIGKPTRRIPRVKGGHHADWLAAVRGGRQAGSSFDYGGPLTELGLLGAIAIRFPGQKLEWDAQGMRVTNLAAANALVNPPYRTGWTL